MLTSEQHLKAVVKELRNLPTETEWFEFKENQANPEDIGEYISALANSAALLRKPTAYMVWGIDDANHEIVGTKFRHSTCKVGNEELENWLLRLLNPKIDFRFHEVTVDEKCIVLLEIDTTTRQPVQFKGIEYIRIGSYKKKLKEFPEKERRLWQMFDTTAFEDMCAAQAEDKDICDLFGLLEIFRTHEPTCLTRSFFGLAAFAFGAVDRQESVRRLEHHKLGGVPVFQRFGAF